MKQIKLVNGKIALVDDQDYEYLSNMTWYYRKDQDVAVCDHLKGYTNRMHRIIAKNMGIDVEDLIIKHRDRNNLNNTRRNLIFVSLTRKLKKLKYKEANIKYWTFVAEKVFNRFEEDSPGMTGLDHFADAFGMTPTEASRWLEVM